jgi:phosphatidylserine synthase
MKPSSPIDVSNALTYGSLMCGIAAVPAALQANAAGCGALLALAVVLDTFDGRFARLVRRWLGQDRHPRVGAELDSLVDAITFGIVPIACATALFDAAGLIWWGAAFVYVASAVTRLGNYNVSAASVGARHFVGVPTPVAALLWSSLFLFKPDEAALIVMALALAGAMNAPVRIARPASAGLALFIAWPVALLVAHCSRL